MNKDNAKNYLPLVQALAEGKTIQYKHRRSDGLEEWRESEEGLDFVMTADRYRIKPEPREIWINEYAAPHFAIGPYLSEQEAKRLATLFTHRTAKQVRYREVIE